MANDISLLLKAFHFAADKHRGQKRKDAAGTPYINHPLEVAELIARVGKVEDINVLLAALLHDTVEDTETTPEEIEREFGKEVAAIVQEVTDDKSLPKQERKRRQVETAAKKSHGARLIKLADKIANVRNLIESPPTSWDTDRKQEYVEWAESVVEKIRGTNEELEKLFDEVAKKANQSSAGAQMSNVND